MTSPRHIRRHAEVRTVLLDPRFVVPPAHIGDSAPGTMRWLRQTKRRLSFRWLLSVRDLVRPKGI
jgi:hypothetical protein